MTYCLNPQCNNPQNPHDAYFCQNCGLKLWLGASLRDGKAGRYQPLQILGQGGFGRTFVALDQADPQKTRVVIKQIIPNRQPDPQKAVALFQQEVQRLEELGQHPQIPHLLGHFEQDSFLYLIQEFIDGENLEQVLSRQGSFDEPKIRQLLEELLPVLAFIHSHRVVHRDVKPENVIWRKDEGGRMKDERSGAKSFDLTSKPIHPSSLLPPPSNLVLVDFGASKFIAENRLQKTGTMIGSAGYAAPEQVMGKGTFASDLYSLGVTCIHLLTGQHPFDLYSVSKDEWAWQPFLPAPISVSLQRVLEKLLQRATSQRYQSATEVLRDLKLEAVPAIVPQIPAEASVSRAALRSPPARPLAPSPSRTSPPRPPASDWICTSTLMGHSGSITTIALHPQNPLIASGSADRTIKLWNLESGELEYSFSGRSLRFSSGHSDRITGLAFSPDGELLISSSDDGTLKFWSLLDYRLITTISGHGWGMSAIATSSNSPVLASGDVDGRIDLWDLETGEPMATLGKHRDRVTALLLSPDGRTLISSSADKTIRLWDLESDARREGRAEGLIQTLRGHNERISAIAITSDWRTLVSASVDREIRFWDLNRGERGRTVSVHTAPIHGLAIAPDNSTLATGSEDNAIKLWHLQPDEHGAITLVNRRPLTLFHSWAVNTVAFSSDGETLVSGSADETIRIWRRKD